MNRHRKGRWYRSCGRRKRRALGRLFGLAAPFLAEATLAQSPPEAAPRADTAIVEFDIPAQPVPAALSDFARQSRLQFLLITEGFDDVEANPLSGTYPVQEGLDRLLEGTGLTASYSPDTGIVLRPERPPPAAEPAPPAVAEDSGAPEDDDETPAVLDEISVTGSRIRGAQSASPIVILEREDIERAGLATVEQLIDRLPQSFGGGASLDTLTDTVNDSNLVGGNVGNEAGGTSVNLRGLGASSTLVLVDGRRLSPGGFGSAFTNLGSIPLTAIERIEVLTDGASAIHGSDAIGGVVNFILRDDYEGASTRLRYGADDNGDLSDVLFAQSFGSSWNAGNVLLLYEFYDSGNLANADRDFTATSDLRRFGGADRRPTGGSPANIEAGGRLWAIPAGQDGRSLTAADFPADANGDPLATPNRFNDRSLGDVLPALTRHSAVVKLTQDAGPVEWSADARFSSQETVWRRNFNPIDVVVTDANPYFVDPTGTGLTMVTVQNYALDNELGPQVNTGDIESLAGSLTARFDVGAGWRGELIGNWGREDQERRTNLMLDEAALAAAVNPTDPNVDPDRVFNPFGDDPRANAALIESLIDRSPPRQSASENEIRSVVFNVDGRDLFGGPLEVVAGTEFRRESLRTGRNFDDGEVVSNLSRDVTSVYAEAFFPMVIGKSGKNGKRGEGGTGGESGEGGTGGMIEDGSGAIDRRSRFEISVAARYEHYSDVGDSVNPKLGLLWSPSPAFTLRGTWGRSFKAPALLDLDENRRSANFSLYLPQSAVDQGAVPFPMIGLSGGNAALDPERAVTWTVGFEWRPPGRDLSLDLGYFNVDFDDRIVVPLTSFAEADEPRFASLVNRSPTLDEIAVLVASPGWLNPSGASEADLLSGAVPVAVVDGRLNNLARSVVTGAELQLMQRFETAAGSFDLSFNGSYLFDFERALLDGEPLIEEVDIYGRPVDFRARAGITWQRGDWSVSGFVNYTDGYTDRLSEPARSVESWSTGDLTVDYDARTSDGWLRDTRVSFTVQNVLDADPPFVNTPGGLAYDSYNADPQGRVLSFQIVHDW